MAHVNGRPVILLILALGVLAGGCDAPEPETADLSVAFVWTYHEPLGLFDPSEIDPAVGEAVDEDYPLLLEALKLVPETSATMAISSTTLADLAELSVVHPRAESFLADVRGLAASNQVEIAAISDANTIIPLIVDGWIGLSGSAGDVRSPNRFKEETDAVSAIRRGSQAVEDVLGVEPVGMVSGGGAISEKTLELLSGAGLSWSVIGEETLEKSLGNQTIRAEDGQVIAPNVLYQPWMPQDGGPTLLPTDRVLGHLISDVYPSLDSGWAAADFLRRLQEIADGIQAPSIVTIVVDSSVPWRYYEDGGRDFLVKTFEGIEQSKNLQLVTPTSFLGDFEGVPETLPSVWPGSLNSFSLGSWVGEEEEAAAWNLLWLVRQDLLMLSREGRIPDDEIFPAFEAMGRAESGDWFRWYGADADTGDDRKMDELFRESLGMVYDRLGEPRSKALGIPLIPARSESRVGGTWAAADGTLDIHWTPDGPEVRLELPGTSEAFTLWVSAGSSEPSLTSDLGTVLGMAAHASFGWSATSPGSVEVGASSADRLPEMSLHAQYENGTVTFVIPEEQLGTWEVGEPLRFRIEYTDAVGDPQGLVPVSGPAQILAGVSAVMDIVDPTGDDYGPGTYSYPNDARFTPGALDMVHLEMGTSDEFVVIGVTLAADVPNPFQLDSGVGLQVLDIAFDTDPRKAAGHRLFPEGRNVAVAIENGYEALITVDGDGASLKSLSDVGVLEKSEVPVDLRVAPGTGLIVLRIPRQAFGGVTAPEDWGIAATISAADIPGPRQVRPPGVAADQWSGGGAKNDSSYPGVYDILWPVEGVQEMMLSSYNSVPEGQTPDLEDFAPVPMNSR